jgi:hypothetical protein
MQGVQAHQQQQQPFSSHQQPIHSQQQHMQGQHMQGHMQGRHMQGQGQHMQGQGQQYQPHHQYQIQPRPQSAPSTSSTFQASTPAMMTKDSSIPSLSLPSSFNLSQVSNIGAGTESGSMTRLLLGHLETTNNPAVSQPAADVTASPASRSTMNTPTIVTVTSQSGKNAEEDEEDEEGA